MLSVIETRAVVSDDGHTRKRAQRLLELAYTSAESGKARKTFKLLRKAYRAMNTAKDLDAFRHGFRRAWCSLEHYAFRIRPSPGRKFWHERRRESWLDFITVWNSAANGIAYGRDPIEASTLSKMYNAAPWL